MRFLTGKTKRRPGAALQAVLPLSLFLLLVADPPARYLTFEEARGVVKLFPDSPVSSSADWDASVRKLDLDIRARISRGIEDSISNLILYGTSYTKLSRPETAEPGERVREFIAALGRPDANERLLFAKDFLSRRGLSGAELEAYLSRNLQRFTEELRTYQENLRKAGEAGGSEPLLLARGTLYEKRGLSVDTSLLPNYAIEDTLRVMLGKGAIASGAIRRVAVIGPGLDFVDKRDAYDFYPLQTIQPFAVMEALVRLKLAQPSNLQITACDINPLVLSHIARLPERTAYIIQLPYDPQAGWTPAAIAYWDQFGDIVGAPAQPVPLPPGLPALKIRAVAVKPEFVQKVRPLDLDVVTQTADEKFDLVVVTNVLVYYDRFQQALAMASIAHMMNSGGIFLANHVLPAQHPDALQYLGRRSINYSLSGAFGDDIVAYRRRP
jgi:hypothetical protein